MLLRHHPLLTLCVALLALLSGALPAIFAALVGKLVDHLPEVAEARPDPSADSGVAIWWIPGSLVPVLIGIAVVLALQPVVAGTQSIVSSDLYWRYDRALLARVMATVTGGHSLAMHEDPELAARTDRAVRIARFGPGELVSGLSAKWAAQAQGGFATLLVGSVSPIAALVLFALWVVLARFLRSDFYRANPFWTDPLRRADYLKRLGLRPDAAKEVRIFGLTDWLTDRFGVEWARVTAELWRSRRVGGRTMTVLTVVLLAAHLIVLLSAARSAADGTLGVAELTVLVQGVFGMAMLASLDGDIWIENGAVPVPDVLDHEDTVARLNSGGRTEPTQPVDTRPAAPGPEASAPTEHGLPQHRIRFDGVRFGYPGGRLVYESLDLDIEAGRSLAVVGLNGAGKTTLVKLLTGLWRPDAGRILVDEQDLTELVGADPARWRRQLAVIFQDFVRFPFTAAENVGVGAHPSGPWQPEMLRRAADRAGATELIERLPDSWDTPLSRRYTGGLDLSGGQWQRIALARAMAAVQAGARVLVLDEPTAQLDARAEAELYDRFLEVTRGLTSIVISHRFSTVRRADRIVVLEHGAVVEDGTHDELVALDGRYAALFLVQASRYRDQPPGPEPVEPAEPTEPTESGENE